MRLIDADKLMENKFKNDISYNAFCNLVKRQPSIDAVQYTDDEIQRMHDIEQAQIQKAYDLGYAEGKADAVPVVRCKDCKYYGRVDKRRFYRGGDCTKGIISTIVPDKDFCSRGERKES